MNFDAVDSNTVVYDCCFFLCLLFFAIHILSSESPSRYQKHIYSSLLLDLSNTIRFGRVKWTGVSLTLKTRFLRKRDNQNVWIFICMYLSTKW